MRYTHRSPVPGFWVLGLKNRVEDLPADATTWNVAGYNPVVIGAIVYCCEVWSYRQGS